MNRVRAYLSFLFVISMLVVPFKAFAFFGADLGVGYWMQTPSGTMSYKPTPTYVGNPFIDLKDDLYFEEENKPFVRLKVELPLILPNVYLMATPMSFKGAGPLTRTITYGDKVFTAGIPVESEIKLDHYDLALFYPIPFLKTATLGKLNVELGLNARKFDFEGTISQPTILNQTASKSYSVTVPMIYAGVQVKPIDALSIEFEMRGIAYDGNSYYDYLGRLRYNPIPLVYVAGGYRAETLKIDAEDVLADIKFGGPFLEVGLSF